MGYDGITGRCLEAFVSHRRSCATPGHQRYVKLLGKVDNPTLQPGRSNQAIAAKYCALAQIELRIFHPCSVRHARFSGIKRKENPRLGQVHRGCLAKPKQCAHAGAPTRKSALEALEVV